MRHANRKKIIALLLTVMTLVMLLPASAFAQSFEVHEIACYHEKCPGYCYLYDKPSSMNGNNLGRLNNGTTVYFINKSGSFYYVRVRDGQYAGKYGYIHNYSSTSLGFREDPDQSRGGSARGQSRSHDSYSSVLDETTGWYHNGTVGPYNYPRDDPKWIYPIFEYGKVECYHSACPGYCYLYDYPSTMSGNNIGYLPNGTRLFVLRKTTDCNYLWVRVESGQYEGRYGYIHYYSATY